MEDAESQTEELLALQSIYDEKYFVVDGMYPPCGRFSAHIQLPDHFRVKLQLRNVSADSDSLSASCSRDFEVVEVKYLPPINMYFEYPEKYPSSSPPAFLLSCCWLTYDQLSQLCKHLDDLWRESSGAVILFQWAEFLREETLDFLGIKTVLDITELSNFKLKSDTANKSSLDVEEFKEKCTISDDDFCNNFQNTPSRECGQINLKRSMVRSVKPSVAGGNGIRDCRAFLEIADGKVLKGLLKDYDEFKRSEHFSESWHVCTICFAEKQGSQFVTFRACQHNFCRDCIKSYFELLISEGSVHSLNCPYDKCDSQADGTFVKQVVSKELFEQYDALLLSITLETMSDIAYCPRKSCQCASLIDVSGRLGTCTACNFTFCPYCKVAYHGIAPCKFDPALKKQICHDYLNGDKFLKAEIELRHGKRTIKCLVEEVLSEEWLGSNSKLCPHCKASIEKTEGCNKMTCFRCGTYFCWLCMKQLKASNPYTHYSDRSSECYDKLFPPEYLDQEFMFEPGAFLNF